MNVKSATVARFALSPPVRRKDCQIGDERRDADDEDKGAVWSDCRRMQRLLAATRADSAE